MSRFSNYLDEIKKREKIGLSLKPINDGELLEEIITNILDNKSKYHSESLNFFIYNVPPGTTPVVVLSAILGRIPSIDEYKAAIRDIQLTKFKLSSKEMTSKPNHLVSF